MSGRWVPISELLDAYEERAAEELAGRGPRGFGHVCPRCGAEFARETQLWGHARRCPRGRDGGSGRAA